MFRMPSAALMKSLYVGGAPGLRTLANSTRAEGAPRITSWRDQTIGRGFGSRVPVYCRAKQDVRSKKDSPVSSASSAGAPFNFTGHKSTDRVSAICYRHLQQRRGDATMVSTALKQSANVVSDVVELTTSEEDVDEFLDVAHKMADAAGQIIRQYFRTKIDILDKDDSSPVTIADRRAEDAMSVLIKEYFPTHGIYGEEYGLHMPEERAEYVWVLDPIDGTKSFITGKPLFGTLIALVHKGVPILGIIDQPVLRERWVGRAGKGTTLNGEPIASRSSTSALKDAYLYTTSPHLFAGSKEEAFNRVRDKVKIPLYGCDCYAYGLLAGGHVDLVVESGLKPYDFLALIPVIEGAGGFITDWEGKSLRFWPNSEYPSVGDGGVEVAAAGSAALHRAALAALDWK